VNLRIPGPTPCPPEVLAALSGQMINHRGPEFAALQGRVLDGVRHVFQTSGDVLILSCAGTGGLEAAVTNVLSPGDKVLSVSSGVFGDRLASIAAAYGAEVTRRAVEWGEGVEPDRLREWLSEAPDVSAVLLTHNETSTGVTNPLESLSAVAREAGKLTIVDAVSSMSSVPCPVDEWELDAVVSGSQKGWMVPPGLAFVSMNEHAWAAYERARMPRFYFDLGKQKAAQEKGQTAWTPALSIYYAMDVALPLLLEEGLPAVFERHRRGGAVTRDAVKGLGLDLFANQKYASDTVTAVNWPEGIELGPVLKKLRLDHGVVFAGGQGKLAGKIIRIGHLGYFNEEQLLEAVGALGDALAEAGWSRPASRQRLMQR
jgi:aspartate aminotransferase-like enzyme